MEAARDGVPAPGGGEAGPARRRPPTPPSPLVSPLPPPTVMPQARPPTPPSPLAAAGGTGLTTPWRVGIALPPPVVPVPRVPPAAATNMTVVRWLASLTTRRAGGLPPLPRTWDQLPPAAWEGIAAALPVASLVALQRVCTATHAAATDNAVWNRRIEQDFPAAVAAAGSAAVAGSGLPPGAGSDATFVRDNPMMVARYRYARLHYEHRRDVVRDVAALEAYVGARDAVLRSNWLRVALDGCQFTVAIGLATGGALLAFVALLGGRVAWGGDVPWWLIMLPLFVILSAPVGAVVVGLVTRRLSTHARPGSPWAGVHRGDTHNFVVYGDSVLAVAGRSVVSMAVLLVLLALAYALLVLLTLKAEGYLHDTWTASLGPGFALALLLPACASTVGCVTAPSSRNDRKLYTFFMGAIAIGLVWMLAGTGSQLDGRDTSPWVTLLPPLLALVVSLLPWAAMLANALRTQASRTVVLVLLLSLAIIVSAGATLVLVLFPSATVAATYLPTIFSVAIACAALLAVASCWASVHLARRARAATFTDLYTFQWAAPRPRILGGSIQLSRVPPPPASALDAPPRLPPV